MKTRPPATTGELWPLPTAARQRIFGVSFSFQGTTFSVVLPLRFGPSQPGQSAAAAAVAQRTRRRDVRAHLAAVIAGPLGRGAPCRDIVATVGVSWYGRAGGRQ